MRGIARPGAVLVAAWPPRPPPPNRSRSSTRGKQLTLIVGSTPGGGYDTQARLVARHIGRHIPGNPTVVVQNMPAAGSLAATNHMFNVAAKDGSTIALIQRGMLLVKNWNPGRSGSSSASSSSSAASTAKSRFRSRAPMRR